MKLETRNRILETTWHLMEQQRGQNVSMSRIAKQTGISRQALYLHFDSRIDLMIATVNYVDEVKGLKQRFERFNEAKTGEELLEACVEVWGNYIPEIFGLAKALLATHETDEATATAWKGCMSSLREFCQFTIDTLEQEGVLSAKWTSKEATEMFWALISIHNWEQLTVECGWSNEQYIAWMKELLKRTLLM